MAANGVIWVTWRFIMGNPSIQAGASFWSQANKVVWDYGPWVVALRLAGGLALAGRWRWGAWMVPLCALLDLAANLIYLLPWLLPATAHATVPADPLMAAQRTCWRWGMYLDQVVWGALPLFLLIWFARPSVWREMRSWRRRRRAHRPDSPPLSDIPRAGAPRAR